MNQFPQSFDRYEVSSAQFPYREPTKKERSIMVVYRLTMAVIRIIIFLICVAVACYVFSLLTEHAAEDNRTFNTVVALIFLVATVIGGLSYILPILRTGSGVCEAVIVEARHGHKVGVRHTDGDLEEIVDVWVPQTQQYCRGILYYNVGMTDFINLKPGDAVKIYKVNDIDVFAQIPRE